MPCNFQAKEGLGFKLGAKVLAPNRVIDSYSPRPQAPEVAAEPSVHVSDNIAGIERRWPPTSKRRKASASSWERRCIR